MANGKVCVVTGANRGIGRETAVGLAARGWRVVLACRDIVAAEDAARAIRAATANPRVEALGIDLASQRSIRAAAARYLASHDRLDVLIHNAAVVTRGRELTTDGIERQLAVNHLGPFLLTYLWRDLLAASAPARVVVVSSEAHRWATLDPDDLNGTHRYSAQRTYQRTKLANILFTYALARRLDGTGVTANALHPGVAGTRLLRSYSRVARLVLGLVQPERTSAPPRLARTSIYLAVSPDVAEITGRYFRRSRAVPSSKASYDRATQERLWAASARLTGIPEQESG
ncbi:MAG TPA: SDR family oxidoreductase [Gemmatimonadales bacterium]|nr:SDR family oxidoreductase [Gemmatimonadales bacterium]